MSAPICRYCGAKIAEDRRDKNIRTEEQAARGIGGSEWITVERLPQSLEEAQRLSNYKVTKVWWASSGTTAEGINCIRTWDGESYELRHGYFCKVDCAARFGRAMAARGARL